MNTDDLIAALAADATPQERPIGQALAWALAGGALLSLALFAALLGPRPDALGALRTLRFDLKFLEAAAWAAPSFLFCRALARPETEPSALLAWLLAPVALLGAGVVAELTLMPSDLWGVRLIGTNWWHCLTVIPLLSIAPLAALISALRSGAPRSPALTGALAGAASAGVAALMYASNCTDDSPLFVASWYPLATAIVVAAGALAGRQWLRW